MNYIKEINAFYNHMERIPLSASAVALWHALLHINNKAMWIEEFTVSGVVLRVKAGLKESSFKRARTELKEKGYINYQSRSRNQAPIYRMVRLSFDKNEIYQSELADATIENEHAHHPIDSTVKPIVDQPKDELQDGSLNDEKVVHSADHQAGHDITPYNSMVYLANHPTDQGMNHQAGHLTDREAAPLIKQKQNQTRQDKTVAIDALQFFQENFGRINPFVMEDLLHWVKEIGEPLLLHAMKRTLEQGKSNWAYVKGILQSWIRKGITTVEQADAEEIAFRKQQQQPKGSGVSTFNNGPTEEVVPDWFRKQKQQEKQLQEKTQKASHSSKELFADVERRLATYRG
ncbi:DnaD domain-containing protein [Oceanobacillus polygoni]|uniref:DnaD/phage-associated family protein n=1 Tax=Oceanobacillus polygoni TaxID=1235259 RepID=A0A9X0YT22_9BACI|nr:DnaD domain protein [Oceanobacillus polygoni]MBP2078413.1 DnaD/phage-associated family protein [Oceanobacillus polygoni]